MHPQNSVVVWAITERQLVVDLYTCWDSAKRLCEILTSKVGSIMDIVHCYDAILHYAIWYPQFRKRCLYRESRLPAVKALRLPYIEKAKDISLNELILMIWLQWPSKTSNHSYLPTLLQYEFGATSKNGKIGPCAEIGRAIGF